KSNRAPSSCKRSRRAAPRNSPKGSGGGAASVCRFLLRMLPNRSTNSGHMPKYCRTLQQSFISSAADELSLLEVEDHVARAHGAHAVRDQNHGVPPAQAAQRDHEFMFRQPVERAGRFVQQQHRSLAIKRAGDADSLSLPAAHGDAAVADLLLVSMRQSHDEL